MPIRSDKRGNLIKRSQYKKKQSTTPRIFPRYLMIDKERVYFITADIDAYFKVMK